MEIMDVREIPGNNIEQTEGAVPFTVVHLPSTEYGVTEDPYINYDQFHLRVGEDRSQIIASAQEEFRGYGFPAGRFYPEFVYGNILFEEEVLIDPDPASVNGFNFWTAEGLVGEHFKEAEVFPKIKTKRQQTRNLFYSLLRDGHKARKFEEAGLVEMLTDPEKTCTIMVPPEYLRRESAWERSRNRCGCETAIMNYGFIWDAHSSYFLDPESKQWYQLMNRDIPSSRRDMYERSSKRLPGVGVVTKIDGATFRESDKVCDRSFLYFDGLMSDVFEVLRGGGVSFDDGILG